MTDPRKLPLRLSREALEQAIEAVRHGGVDALFVEGSEREWVFAREGEALAYRLLIEEMPEGAVTLTSDGLVVYANRGFAEMLGAPLQRVIGSRIDAWVVPEQKEAVLTLLASSRGAKNTLELELLTTSGVRLPALLSTGPLVGVGIADAISMVVTDLTVQKRSEVLSQARQDLLEEIKARTRTEEDLRISVATLRLRERALAAVSQGVLITGPDRLTTFVNRAFEVITGYSQAEMTGRSCAILQGPDTSAETVRAIREALGAAKPFHGEVLNYRKDGSAFWNELSIAPVFDAAGTLSQYVGVQRDVSARRYAESQILLAAQVFEQGSEGIIITDADNLIIKVNHAFTTITGFTETEALGRDPSFLGSGQHSPAFFEAMWQELTNRGHWQGELWNRHKNGMPYPSLMFLSRLVDAAQQLTHYIGSFSDITQRKEDEINLQRMAHFDQMTGLPNRTLLEDRATQALQAAERNDEALALMFVDLDNFKKINDSLGHRIGDCVLKAAAERLMQAVRQQDTVSRVGGDEFVLILPETDAAGATRVAEKILAETALPMQVEENELGISPSIGIAMYPVDGADFETLYHCADAAMYRAKYEGGNALRFYTDEMQAHSERMLMIENGLRRALEREQMQLYYQPQSSLSSGKIIGAEALLRWQHPQMGWVGPAEFIPIAESCGLIHPLGEWVLRTALRQFREWLANGMAQISMSVNLSGVQLRHPNLPELINRIVEEAGVPAECLELELTESVSLNDPLGAIAVMEKLHASGVRIAIDDFGTGYSSLSYLKRFKINRLKIDRSFVGNICDDPNDQAIVTAIISLAGSLGLRTIAEGVETAAQMEHLHGRGCDEIQGYWLSKPLPAEQFAAFMAAR